MLSFGSDEAHGQFVRYTILDACEHRVTVRHKTIASESVNGIGLQSWAVELAKAMRI